MKRIYIPIVLFCILLCVSACASTSQSSSLDEYLETDIPLLYSEFALFPQKESLELCRVNQYQSTSVSHLLFDDVYFLLNCTYTPQQFEQEILRFEQAGAEYHDDLFNYPAYVMVFYSPYYEYALLDAENCTIIYVSANASDFAPDSPLDILKDFPQQYLPVNIPEIEICKYD